MKTLAIITAFIAISMALSYNICPNSTNACAPGATCCYSEAKGTYTCCRSSLQCCYDGSACCYPSRKHYDLIIGTDSSPSIDLKPTRDDYYVIIESLLEEIGFFDYFPQTFLCEENLVKLYPVIIEYIEKFKNIKSALDVVQVALDAFHTLYPKVQEIVLGCGVVPSEIKDKLNEILSIVSKPGYGRILLENVTKNLSNILTDIQNARKNFSDREYKECGKNIGLAINLIFKLN